MELLKQIRIAVVGLPDSGKSTLIENIFKVICGKIFQPDTLMNEVHWSDGKDPYGNPDTRTIKCAKVFLKYKDIEFCFYDCPGHVEYMDEINQGIYACCGIIGIVDSNRNKESEDYLEKIKEKTEKNIIKVYSHSEETTIERYDVNNDGFLFFAESLLSSLYGMFKNEAIDIEEEAIDLINMLVNGNKRNGMFFSGGKDSLVGLDLYYRTNKLKHFNVYFPCSGYDFKETLNIINEYEKLYHINIKSFDNSLGCTYEKNGSYKMLMNKAEANNKLIKKEGIEFLSIQYRASDEGVRSKDFYYVKRDNHFRFSPVFYFSETNIWRYISKYNLKVCKLYFEGYRSLGDRPITTFCMPETTSVDEIIEYIDSNPNTNERDGRKKQDNSVDFAMEKLRDKGFF